MWVEPKSRDFLHLLESRSTTHRDGKEPYLNQMFLLLLVILVLVAVWYFRDSHQSLVQSLVSSVFVSHLIQSISRIKLNCSFWKPLDVTFCCRSWPSRLNRTSSRDTSAEAWVTQHLNIHRFKKDFFTLGKTKEAERMHSVITRHSWQEKFGRGGGGGCSCRMYCNSLTHNSIWQQQNKISSFIYTGLFQTESKNRGALRKIAIRGKLFERIKYQQQKKRSKDSISCHMIFSHEVAWMRLCGSWSESWSKDHRGTILHIYNTNIVYNTKCPLSRLSPWKQLFPFSQVRRGKGLFS